MKSDIQFNRFCLRRLLLKKDNFGPASMGPQRFSRGNTARPFRRACVGVQLQWGRGVSAAEMALGYVPVFLLSYSHVASTYQHLQCSCHRYLCTHLLQHLSFAHYESLLSLALDTVTRAPAYRLLITTPLALLTARASSLETVYITRGCRSSTSIAMPKASNRLMG